MNLKYLAIGIVAGILIPYVIAFMKNRKENNTITHSRHSYDSDEGEDEE
jgi:uncharacterized membrane-anchored protein YhcB (DUF1043 family)